MSGKRRSEFWVSRLAVELATALASLELNDPTTAQNGLKSALHDYFRENNDPELSSFVAEMRRVKQIQASSEVSLPTPAEATVTVQDILDVFDDDMNVQKEWSPHIPTSKTSGWATWRQSRRML